MWKETIEEMFKILPEDLLIKKLEVVHGGITIVDTTEMQWYYNPNEGTLTKLSRRKNRR